MNIKEKRKKERKRVFYHIGRLSEKKQLKLDTRDSLTRSASERIELGFIPIKLPAFNDAPYRIFNTMEEYRIWAEKSLPKWLGYYR